MTNMLEKEKYMRRAIELAKLGTGKSFSGGCDCKRWRDYQ